MPAAFRARRDHRFQLQERSAQTFASAGTSLDRLADLLRYNMRFRSAIDLASEKAAKILTEEWRSAHDRHGWAIGRYVIMPDHVHFFCSAELDAKSLPVFMQASQQWTSKRMARELNFASTIWQEEFFDHVLRSTESYSQKWDYVRENPVRAGLVTKMKDWPWQGEIESLIV